MKFQLSIEVDVPDHIAATMPQAPDLQLEFQALVNQAVATTIEAWAAVRDEARVDGETVPSHFENVNYPDKVAMTRHGPLH